MGCFTSWYIFISYEKEIDNPYLTRKTNNSDIDNNDEMNERRIVQRGLYISSMIMSVTIFVLILITFAVRESYQTIVFTSNVYIFSFILVPICLILGFITNYIILYPLIMEYDKNYKKYFGIFVSTCSFICIHFVIGLSQTFYYKIDDFVFNDVEIYLTWSTAYTTLVSNRIEQLYNSPMNIVKNVITWICAVTFFSLVGVQLNQMNLNYRQLIQDLIANKQECQILQNTLVSYKNRNKLQFEKIKNMQLNQSKVGLLPIINLFPNFNIHEVVNRKYDEDDLLSLNAAASSSLKSTTLDNNNININRAAIQIQERKSSSSPSALSNQAIFVTQLLRDAFTSIIITDISSKKYSIENVKFMNSIILLKRMITLQEYIEVQKLLKQIYTVWFDTNHEELEKLNVEHQLIEEVRRKYKNLNLGNNSTSLNYSIIISSLFDLIQNEVAKLIIGNCFQHIPNDFIYREQLIEIRDYYDSSLI